MAFQSNAFQHNAFQIIGKTKSRQDFEEVFGENDTDNILQKTRERRRLEILAEEAFQKKLEELQQDELDFLDLLIVMLAEETDVNQ